MDTDVGTTVLTHLVFSEDFSRKVMPHLKREYFERAPQQVVFDLVEAFSQKYKSLPTKEALVIDLSNKTGLSETLFKEAAELVSALTPVQTEMQWLVDTAEKFCKDRAVFLALQKAVEIIDSKNGKLLPESIPEMLSAALAITFDDHVGHDYVMDWEHRYEFYHRKEEKIPFDLEYMNKITDGGVVRKSLTVLLAGTGVGKSLSMCHYAANNITDGFNVLYISAEMPEEQVAMRIDANLLGVDIKELKHLSHEVYERKIKAASHRIKGRLIIKEYPTTSAHAGHIRALLNELSLKKNFRPDVIYVDYLNIMTSSRYKAGANVNSYTIVKAIAEELRGLSMEFNAAVFTATQLTRAGMSSSDPEMKDTSESIGVPFTADLMYAIYTNEDLLKLMQCVVKQLKNRYNDMNLCPKFVMGMDRSRMRLYNVEASAQAGITKVDDDEPVFDKSTFGQAFPSSLKDKIARLI